MNARGKATLTLAHSADADDVFMWWPITGKIDPANPGRVVEPPAIDTGRFSYRALPEDIQALNRRAIERGDLDITAVSFFAYPAIRARYAVTSCGSSFGDGYGPKVVGRPGVDGAALRRRGVRIAVPGRNTSAFCALTALLGAGRFEAIETPFDRVVEAVTDGRADAGVVIHEAQLTFGGAGLALIEDLGAWWKGSTGLPMPLGANAVRLDLEDRFGAGTLEGIAATLRNSIEHAVSHAAEGRAYAMGFSPLKTDAELARYIGMYVNRWTVDCRPDGVRAVERLLAAGHAAGLCDKVDRLRVIGAPPEANPGLG